MSGTQETWTVYTMKAIQVVCERVHITQGRQWNKCISILNTYIYNSGDCIEIWSRGGITWEAGCDTGEVSLRWGWRVGK